MAQPKVKHLSLEQPRVCQSRDIYEYSSTHKYTRIEQFTYMNTVRRYGHITRKLHIINEKSWQEVSFEAKHTSHDGRAPSS